MWKDVEKQGFKVRFPRRRLRHLNTCLLCVFLVLTMIAVVVTGVLFSKNEQKKESRHSLQDTTQENSKVSPLFNPTSPALLGVFAAVNLNDFDPTNGISYTVGFNTFSNTRAANPPYPIACVIADDFNSGDLVPFLEINPATFFFVNHTGGLNASADGALTQYPFDVYTSQILLGAVASSTPATLASSCNQITPQDIASPIPFRMGLGQSLPGFSATFTIKPLEVLQNDGTTRIKPNNYVLELTVRRDRIIKFFAVAMFIIVWLLTLVMVVASGQAILYNAEPRFELVGANTALLFALPQIRDSQPGMPVIPTISDVVGYYWAIAFLGLSTFALVAHAIWQLKLEKDKKLRDAENLLPVSTGSDSAESLNMKPPYGQFDTLIPNRL